MQALVVDDDDLAGFHVADEFGADDVERARFRRQDPGFAQPSQDQRPHPVGIAQSDQLFLGDADQGIGAFDLGQGVGHAVDDAPVFADRDQVDDGLGVGSGLEDAAPLHQSLPNLIGVGEVAVMGQGEAAELEVREQRLHVPEHRFAGRRIAHVADGDVAREPFHDLGRVEVVADQAQRPVAVELFAVIGDDAGRFLAPVLERVQAKRRVGGGIR